MRTVSKYDSLYHYKWADDCDGWILADTEGLSVKQEYMPAHAAELLHFHERAQQFFFILKGTATFEVEDQIFIVRAGHGFHIAAGEKHRIVNNSTEDLEFLLSSQPSTNNDRYNCI